MDTQYDQIQGDVPAQPVIAEIDRSDQVADQLRSTVSELVSRLEHVRTPPAPETVMTPGENLVAIEGPPLSPTAHRVRSIADVVDEQTTRLRRLLRELQV